MKTWAILAAAAALTIGSAANAGEPVKLDEAALDNVTAGNTLFSVSAFTTFPSAQFTSPFGALGSASTSESSFASGERRSVDGNESLGFVARASGQSRASGFGGQATATSGGGVFIGTFPFAAFSNGGNGGNLD